MGAYLALASQLVGRPQDALYHVLIDPPEIENHREFYFPTRNSRRVPLPGWSCV